MLLVWSDFVCDMVEIWKLELCIVTYQKYK